jgi:GNAT superfamily N-acetyltransferase
MNHMPAVRRFQAGDTPAATAIIRGLPDYFTHDVPAKVEHDAASHQAWVLTDSGTVAGFAVAATKSPSGAEILWIAIDATRRGRGHGTRLLSHVLDHLAADGISVVKAKTLDRSSGYRPTRPPGPSGNATASSTSTRSTRRPAGNPATQPQFT